MKKNERNDAARLLHIRDAARKAVKFVEGQTRESLDENEMLVLALVATLTIIGEAASQVTAAFRDAQPQIPWTQMIGTRHRVVHAYDEVDLDIVWDTVTKNLPALLSHLDAILSEDDNAS